MSTGIEGILRTQSTKGFAQVSAYVNAIGDYVAPRAVGTVDVEGEDGPVEVPLVNFVQQDARIFGLEAQGERLVDDLVVLDDEYAGGSRGHGTDSREARAGGAHRKCARPAFGA